MPSFRVSSVVAAATLVASSSVVLAQRQPTPRTDVGRAVRPAARQTPAPIAASEHATVVKVRVARRNVFAPGALQSVVSVTPHADNRRLRIALDSDVYYRSSDVELDGAVAPISHYFTFGSLPAGEYTVVATVFGPEGPRGVNRLEFSVLGLGAN